MSIEDKYPELPKWFQLSKYLDTYENMDISAWATQLRCRLALVRKYRKTDACRWVIGYKKYRKAYNYNWVIRYKKYQEADDHYWLTEYTKYRKDYNCHWVTEYKKYQKACNDHWMTGYKKYQKANTNRWVIRNGKLKQIRRVAFDREINSLWKTHTYQAAGYSKFMSVSRIQEYCIFPTKKIPSSLYVGVDEIKIGFNDFRQMENHAATIDLLLSNDNELAGIDYDELSYGSLSDCLKLAPNIIFLSVNLGLPDSMLKEAFTLFLMKVRNELKLGKSPINEISSKIKSWTKNAVLPYLDLLHWSRECKAYQIAKTEAALRAGVKGKQKRSKEKSFDLPAAWYARRIFPLSVTKTDDSVRESTKPRADEFFTPDTLRELERFI